MGLSVAGTLKAGSGPLGVGTVLELRGTLGPYSIPTEYVVREFDRAHRIWLQRRNDSVHALGDIGFVATPRGTRITCTADMALLGACGAVAPLLKGPPNSQCCREGAGLAKHLRSQRT